MGQVILVRHGQASFGADDYDVLSEAGREQSRVLGRWLRERGVVADVVLHGEMRRQRETAEGLVEAAGWAAEPAVDAGWNEFDHRAVVAAFPAAGDVVDMKAFQAVFSDALDRWVSGDHVEEYPETYVDFAKRAAAALTRACAGAGPGGTVLVSSSGGPIAAACVALLEPERPTVERAGAWQRMNTVILNAAYSRVVVGSTGARLLTFNEHEHLTESLRTYR
jgi:broad specificity phosphatase PhoE